MLSKTQRSFALSTHRTQHSLLPDTSTCLNNRLRYNIVQSHHRASPIRRLTTSRPTNLAQPLYNTLPSTMITEPITLPFLTRPRTRGNRHALPASWMRCGTSKGLFIDRQYLPELLTDWKPWLMAAMGSKNDDVRQLDGIGGATSTTSKVAVVSPSSKPGIDVEYTFAQVAVGKEVVDFSGNCGNIASGVGPFALEQGMVHPRPGGKQIDISILNTNTNSVLVETVSVDEYGCYDETGNYKIAGVAGTGSEVKVAFVDPAGTMTGRLFPTGKTEDILSVQRSNGSSFEVRATMVDAGNPFVLVDGSTLPTPLDWRALAQTDVLHLSDLNGIRCEAAVVMGLATTTDQARLTPGTPKVAVILPSNGRIKHSDSCPDPDVFVMSLSMGKLHPSLQLTGAIAISSALSVKGTVPHRLSGHKAQMLKQTIRMPRKFCIAHRSGTIDVMVEASSNQSGTHVKSCSVSRTARTLFEGQVLFRS